MIAYNPLRHLGYLKSKAYFFRQPFLILLRQHPAEADDGEGGEEDAG